MRYRWCYSWEEIKRYYIQKNREIGDRTSSFASFLVELVSSAMGGGKKDDEVSLDDGEGMDEMTDEQLETMKMMLGEDFAKIYPDYV